MEPLRLSFASQVNERTRPLIDGQVRPNGFDIIPVTMDPPETFWRMLRLGEFDISEMSISSYLMARERGADLVAVPAFPSRRFFQLELMCNRDAGIDQPEDIVGKRIGVGEYQQTAALWSRGILENDFGVSQYDVDWYMERSPEESHGAATGFEPPEGIRFHRLAAGQSLLTMLTSGELDVALARRAVWKHRRNIVERSTRIGVDKEEIARRTCPLFEDSIAEGKRFYAEHGFVPVNHTYVVRGEVHRKHPWVALNLYQAMVEAKRLGERDLMDYVPLSLIFREEFLRQVEEALPGEPFPYGVDANRAALEMVVSYSFEQGLTKEQAEVDSLFAESTVEYSRVAK